VLIKISFFLDLRVDLYIGTNVSVKPSSSFFRVVQEHNSVKKDSKVIQKMVHIHQSTWRRASENGNPQLFDPFTLRNASGRKAVVKSRSIPFM